MASAAARTIDALYEQIDGMRRDNVAIRKTIGDLARGQEDRGAQIMKGLMAAKPGTVAMNWDGSDQAQLIEVASSGRRQKSLGMGRELQAIAIASGQAMPDAIGWDGGDVHKHLKEKAYHAVTDRTVQKGTLAEASGATGGYTLAPQFYMNLLRLMVEESKIRQRCTTIPMTSRTMFVPALDHSQVPVAGTTATLGGILATWQPESQKINQTQPNFRNIELVARDLVFTCVASNQLLMDSALALDTLLTTLFQEGMAWFYDYYLLRGNGANQPRGLINSPAAYTQVSSGSAVFTQTDAAAMMSRLLAQSWDNAVWIMHPSNLPQLVGMTNGATNSGFLTWLNPAPHSGEGGPIAQRLPLGYFMGLPLIFTEKLPALAAGVTGSVILTDLSKQLIGDRLAVQIESSPYPLFQNNQTMWRVIARWDSDNWLNSPVTLADGAFQMASVVLHKASTT